MLLFVCVFSCELKSCSHVCNSIRKYKKCAEKHENIVGSAVALLQVFSKLQNQMVYPKLHSKYGCAKSTLTELNLTLMLSVFGVKFTLEIPEN